MDRFGNAGDFPFRCRWEKGLPLGLQLTAERGEEARVLRAAVRLYNILGHQT
jgi:Asp-tRNA(Asn)/Glu-tRNA(Gln) amidotransferase A subunit family amidase